MNLVEEINVRKEQVKINISLHKVELGRADYKARKLREELATLETILKYLESKA